MTITLDSNVFISIFSKKEANHKLAVLLSKEIYNGNYQAIISSITYGEVYKLSNNNRERFDFSLYLASIENIETMPADDEVCLLASKFRSNKTKIKLPDAIHAATAKLNKVDLFITDDRNIKELSSKSLKITNLDGWHKRYYRKTK